MHREHDVSVFFKHRQNIEVDVFLKKSSKNRIVKNWKTSLREKHRIVKKSEHRPPLVTRAGGFFCHFFSHSFYTLAARKPKAMYFLKTWIDISAGTLLGISARKTQILIILVFVAFVTHP